MNWADVEREFGAEPLVEWDRRDEQWTPELWVHDLALGNRMLMASDVDCVSRIQETNSLGVCRCLMWVRVSPTYGEWHSLVDSGNTMKLCSNLRCYSPTYLAWGGLTVKRDSFGYHLHVNWSSVERHGSASMGPRGPVISRWVMRS